jgi:hypothetical protein
MDVSAPKVMTKADFCRMVGVDRSMANYWRNSNALTDDAFVGTGRGAKVVVAVALEQLKDRLDLTQRVANGRADLEKPATAAVAPTAPVSERVTRDGTRTTAEDELRLERIRKVRLENEALEAKRRAEAGTYVRAETVARIVASAMAQVLSMIENGFEVQAETIAAALKEKGVQVDARDLELLMATAFRSQRAALAKAQAAALAELPSVVEDRAEDRAEDLPGGIQSGIDDADLERNDDGSAAG